MSTIVAITGAKATGKSTLLKGLSASSELLKRYDERVNIIQSPGSKAADLCLPLGVFGSDDTHLFFARAHLANLRRAKSSHENELFLLDRCFIDHCAYVNKLSHSQPLKDLMAEILFYYLKSIDHVLITALVHPFLEKETITEHLFFRKEIEQEILHLIGNYSVAATRLDDPSQYKEHAIDVLLKIGCHHD